MEEDDVKELLGYSDEEFDEYSKLFDFDWNDYGTGDEDLEEEPKEQEEITCPKCGHKFYK
jgi:hypothetical protein